MAITLRCVAFSLVQVNNNVAKVVCRMLGRPGGRVIVDNQIDQFGRFDRRPTLATDLSCRGNEASIFECTMNVDNPDCTHAEDLGIICDDSL